MIQVIVYMGYDAYNRECKFRGFIETQYSTCTILKKSYIVQAVKPYIRMQHKMLIYKYKRLGRYKKFKRESKNYQSFLESIDEKQLAMQKMRETSTEE